MCWLSETTISSKDNLKIFNKGLLKDPKQFLIKLKLISTWSALLLVWRDKNTAWKVSICGAFLVRIFPHSDSIRRDTDQKNSEYGHFSPWKLLLIHLYSKDIQVVQSELFEINSKVSLDVSILFHKIFRRFYIRTQPSLYNIQIRSIGPPSADLSASRLMHQLPTHTLDPQCKVVDPLQQKWTHKFP